MDPVSIIGLTAAIQQILVAVYNVADGVRESKDEINQLCSELLALKAALDHVQMNLSLISSDNSEGSGVPSSSLVSPNLSTFEFKEMIASSETIVKEVLTRLGKKPNALKASLQRLKWPFIKDDVKRYVERLHRLTSWFVLATTSDNLVMCRKSYAQICSIEDSMKQQVAAQERWQSAEEKKVVTEWLAPFDPARIYERSLEVFLEGTGEWFLDGAFARWLDGTSPPVLWLRAKPGAGKTTLLTAAVRRARLVLEGHQQGLPMACFYCSFSHQETHDVRTIIASLLAQLCEDIPALWEDVNKQYLSSKSQRRHMQNKMSLQEGYTILSQGGVKLSGAYLFLDAINESQHSRKMLDLIKNLLRNIPSVRIMMSSTEELDESFEPQEVEIVAMDRRGISRDIQIYIGDWLENDPHLSNLPDSLKAKISSKLQSGNHGVFRWVQCQLEALTWKKTPRDIHNALANVPRTLTETYQGILSRIPSDDAETARQMLFWVSSAMMPMTLTELCEAIIIDEDQVVINEDVRLLNPRGTLELCSSLISYDHRTTTVTLAHSSVLDYLSSKDIRESDVRSYYMDSQDVFQALPRRCIHYLMLPAFSSGCCSNQRELIQRLDSWPLLTYIAETLFDHLEYADLRDTAFKDIVLRFFATHRHPRGGNFGAWVQAFIPRTTFNIESSTPLYYAARFGLVRLVRLLLQTQGTVDLEKPGGVYGSTPLHVAAWAGRREVVKELLDAGANAKETNFDGESGLSWAMRNGDHVIERMLKDAGAICDDEPDELWSVTDRKTMKRISEGSSLQL